MRNPSIGELSTLQSESFVCAVPQTRALGPLWQLAFLMGNAFLGRKRHIPPADWSKTSPTASGIDGGALHVNADAH
jgi:hypothetical protein